VTAKMACTARSWIPEYHPERPPETTKETVRVVSRTSSTWPPPKLGEAALDGEAGQLGVGVKA
jgi:hypothetical protein